LYNIILGNGFRFTLLNTLCAPCRDLTERVFGFKAGMTNIKEIAAPRVLGLQWQKKGEETWQKFPALVGGPFIKGAKMLDSCRSLSILGKRE